jgi:hypothetical protein
MSTLGQASQDVSLAAAAYPDAGETMRLRAGRLRFFRTIAESVGVQGPTAGVVIAPAVLASVSGGGTALVELVAAVAMGFVAYAFIAEPVATRAMALSLAHGADLIIAAYILVVIAAIIFTIRRRMAPAKTVILLVGLAVLGYILKDAFVPLPAAPFSWDALAAGITLAAGIVLPLAYPPVRRGIRNSPLLKAGASALLGTRPGK